MKRIILTGARGFIGTTLLDEFKEDYFIIGIVRTSGERLSHPNICYVQSDINQLKRIDSSDVFIHAAGQAHIVQTEGTRKLFEDNNIRATESALHLALQSGVRKFIFISSVAALKMDDHDMYAQSKKAAEDQVISFCTSHAMEYVIIRSVVVYGEHDQKGNVQKLIKQIQKGFCPIFNAGKTKKYMVYAKNLSYIIKNAIENPACTNSIITASDKEVYSVKEICEAIANLLPNKCVWLPVHIPSFLQEFLPKGLRAKVKKLTSNEQYTFSEVDRELMDSLPYSQIKGLTNTVLSLKKSYQSTLK